VSNAHRQPPSPLPPPTKKRKRIEIPTHPAAATQTVTHSADLGEREDEPNTLKKRTLWHSTYIQVTRWKTSNGEFNTADKSTTVVTERSDLDLQECLESPSYERRAV